ncbi:MAG: bifunctional phosphoribosyl-AMP cyclohydrolase/phosphoribosyl-ATP diphosphatase HisIE [Acidimicrobiia bacterium]|nr:bifunctional phosphoribosyl-AMP cyclohydrolase/phosphoribosyl-ATP diphosphatase HisIE [Acidimicrobiia bacterium]MDH5502471.1 bifunctional phosphoribosyl-AMP cyclohydrolase/phosphoribosyl-ATP diphosphatase HisIE [Acidimicrobiia bacterium]
MVTFNAEGLIPATIQNADTGQVLMMAWMNEESLDATRTSGLVTFWSRSRQELWQKGATSGNELRLVELHPDCDGDALLVLARPAGPACHNGTTSCFDNSPPPDFSEFGHLWATISERIKTRPNGSYTTTLADDHDLAARKVLEEAGEVSFASKDLDAGRGDKQRLIEEMADLVYHTLALAAAQEISVVEIGAELNRRS